MARRKIFDFYREYLNDFKQDEDGKYRYRGAVYAFDGDILEQRSFKLRLTILMSLTAVFTLAPECFPPTEMSRSFITIIPWAMSLAAVFVTNWAGVRLLCRFNDLKEYVYLKTVARLPICSAAASILCAVTMLAQTIYLAVNGFSGEVWLSVIRPALAAIDAVVCFVFFRVARNARFSVK